MVGSFPKTPSHSGHRPCHILLYQKVRLNHWVEKKTFPKAIQSFVAFFPVFFLRRFWGWLEVGQKVFPSRISNLHCSPLLSHKFNLILIFLSFNFSVERQGKYSVSKTTWISHVFHSPPKHGYFNLNPFDGWLVNVFANGDIGNLFDRITHLAKLMLKAKTLQIRGYVIFACMEWFICTDLIHTF